jgi:DNA invertase Pin-like site-specific DNA recombinase
MLKGRSGLLSPLEAEQVKAIRACFAEGKATPRELSDRYGIDVSTIRRILNKKHWAHIE